MYPTDLNFKMPAEWEKHTRTLISWPVQDSMCFPEDYETVCKGYAQIIQAIAEFEPVTVIVNPAELDTVKQLFNEENIDVLAIAHNDAWFRDNGPTFVVSEQGEVAGINWTFNAWGGKYAPWDLDDQVAPQILEQFGLQRFDAPLVMEGGSIHVDGEGTLLTTEECLLNPNRNPHLSREQIEELLKKYVNVEKVIWLKRGLSGDETDGHVDNIACFAAPGKILLQVCDDPEDENYAITQENLANLRNATDALGRKLEIIPIQQPPKTMANGKRLTLSYLNFYFVNGGIILPVFGGTAEETDELAKKVLAAAFPDRRIRTVDGMAIICEGGNVHCTTQQMAAGK
jgi:agmatine deiminase